MKNNFVGKKMTIKLKFKLPNRPRGPPRIRRRKPKRLLLSVMAILALAYAEAARFTCPNECRCTDRFHPEYGHVLQVYCTRGGLRTIPTESLDRNTEVLVLSSPPHRPNFITIGPILTQPIPYSKLRFLTITNSNVPNIEKHPFWGLHNLVAINLTHNEITTIAPVNFRGLLDLDQLNLDGNKIDLIPSEAFKNVPSLRTLTMSSNKITSLVPRIFKTLANLRILDLSYNPIKELDPEVFKDIQRLTSFKCRRCLLNQVNPQVYHLINSLEDLDLGENQFKFLTREEFISLNKLTSLKLDGNQLSVIVDNMFGKNYQLKALTLARNRLALMAPASLTNLTSLQYLDMSYNKIDRFHLQTFTPVIESLKTISFSGNNLPLNEIAIVLQVLPEIQGVSLANLSLDDIPSNFFSYNEHLIVLDISYNKLRTFPYKLLSKMKMLQDLNFSHNRIESLNDRDLMRLESLPRVDMLGNPWSCDQCSAGAMIIYMRTTVLNESIRELKCFSPMKLRGLKFSVLTFDKLEPCATPHDMQLSVVAGLILLCVAIFALIAGILCCVRHRSARYYTNEVKDSDRDMDLPLELLSRTDLSPVATIHSPSCMLSRRS